ncbi:hypothetical protein TCELL_1301 [Thermogladius calderae 1633]|uniref:Uncharacterized protein n=1 Tax=Thermogladius calderae (strain DSM 22663 / VKM B-2946 / 1633) TaxID=1184251 RepID=I3TG36_THEC1|nr:hypothetical protein [Thermogladius calderae]AFK51724.1 hypothetical protein TCELL_1301 [Thermogladius calderae 1633]
MDLTVIYGNDEWSMMIKSIVDFAVEIARREYGVKVEVYEVVLEGFKGVNLEIDGVRELHIVDVPSVRELVEVLVVASRITIPITPSLGETGLATA